ncbi:MAG: hypothetical protein QXM06_04010 [Archaeoglobaceae archaeon]
MKMNIKKENIKLAEKEAVKLWIVCISTKIEEDVLRKILETLFK